MRKIALRTFFYGIKEPETDSITGKPILKFRMCLDDITELL